MSISILEKTNSFKTCARVKLTIEVSNLGTWEKESTIEQVRKQAIESSLTKLNKLFKDFGREIRICEDPEVQILTIQDKS